MVLSVSSDLYKPFKMAAQYGVQFITANFLVNPKVEIINKTHTAKELYKKLKKLLNK